MRSGRTSTRSVVGEWGCEPRVQRGDDGFAWGLHQLAFNADNVTQHLALVSLLLWTAIIRAPSVLASKRGVPMFIIKSIKLALLFAGLSALGVQAAETGSPASSEKAKKKRKETAALTTT